MEKVLFICVHNSARSQMAEEFLRQVGGDKFEVCSAGFEPTEINPLVVEVMREEGIDLSEKKTQSVFDLYKEGKIFNYVITVCKKGTDEDCPIFPGIVRRMNLPFEDPAKLEGSQEEKLVKTREIRDSIKDKVKNFVEAVTSGEIDQFCNLNKC